MDALITALLSNAAFRTLLEGVAIKVLGEFFHRRVLDPAFLQSSDAALGQYFAAKTDEDKANALAAIRALTGPITPAS